MDGDAFQIQEGGGMRPPTRQRRWRYTKPALAGGPIPAPRVSVESKRPVLAFCRAFVVALRTFPSLDPCELRFLIEIVVRNRRSPKRKTGTSTSKRGGLPVLVGFRWAFGVHCRFIKGGGLYWTRPSVALVAFQMAGCPRALPHGSSIPLSHRPVR